jgi:hypothetical protein
MRRILGTLLLLSVLVGCGDDEGTPTADPSADQSGPELVQMIVLTSAGGEVSPEAYFVDDRDQMKAYVKTFEDRDDVTAALQQAAEDAADRDGRLAVATVAIGCDVPPGVGITEGEHGWEVTPRKIVDPKQECFAAATSIALVEIPANPS